MSHRRPRFAFRACGVALTLGSAALIAAAADAFTRFDRDRDGRVTAAELNLTAAFARYDLDGDGVITRAEYDRVTARGRGGPAAERAPADPGLSAADLARLASDPALPRPAELGVGRQVPDVTFRDLEGRAHRLSDWRGQAGLVIAVTSATCPLSKRYLPSLAALEPELRAQGIGLVLVNPFASEDPATIRAQRAGHAFTAPYVHEADRALTGALGARSTTEVFPSMRRAPSSTGAPSTTSTTLSATCRNRANRTCGAPWPPCSAGNPRPSPPRRLPGATLRPPPRRRAPRPR